MSSVSEKKDQFEKTIIHLKDELSTIRTGRSNPSLVENIKVEYYGTKTPLSQVASISAPDPQSIVVQPWDKNALQDIEAALRNSDLGLNPVVESNIIRLPIPPLTEERRVELAKVVNQKVENARISIRNVREEIWKELKEQKNNSEISEDDMFGQQKDLQLIVDEYNEKVKEIGQQKNNEIMTI